MIVPSDPDYINTKLVKQSSEKIDRVFQDLAIWISIQFGTKVLNIYYDTIDTDKNRPRLNIIFEFETEKAKFVDIHGNFDSSRQKSIADKFIEILCTKFPTKKYSTERLFVYFSAFEPVARREAVWNIPKNKIDKLKKELSRNNVWEIYMEFEVTTIFFNTESQIEECTANGTVELIKEKYYKILKKYDEFGYIKRDSHFLTFDSKENFDKNYESNWFWYSRR